MDAQPSVFIGKGDQAVYLNAKLANRHGLIAGATGTGKTVTLQIIAEGFSQIGVPVFMADVKGDLSGISQAGSINDKLKARAEKIEFTGYSARNFPVLFWDLFGEKGHPIRTTISEMGPVLLSRLLDLNETQEGVLTIAFHLADEQGLHLLDMKDLRAMLTHVAENAKDLTLEYGNVSPRSVGAIQRRLLVLEEQGGDLFFGEPALNLEDFMRRDFSGNGVMSVLSAGKLMTNPRLYTTFLLWLLSELFEELPEVGDPDKPKLVFFFDEAHLLFNDTPKALLEKITQVVRLIRSKGVGVYFVTQNPLDIPPEVLGQLGNRVQHALRAFTPKDQKAVRAAAETFRPNPKLDVTETITQLGLGEALVSVLEKKGVPSIVERTLIRPPSSRLGPATEQEMAAVVSNSPIRGKYDQAVDRHSAFEMLRDRATRQEEEARLAKAREERELERERQARERERQANSRRTSSRRSSSRRQSTTEAFFKSMVRTVGTSLGRQIIRGIFGTKRRR